MGRAQEERLTATFTKQFGRAVVGGIPFGTARLYTRPRGTAFVKCLIGEPVFIGQPVLVDVEVLARRYSEHEVVAHPVLAVRSLRVGGDDRRRGGHFPDTRAEAEVDRGERAHGAEVDYVHRVRVIELSIRRWHRVIFDTARDDRKMVAPLNLLRNVRAAGAVDEAIGVDDYV